MAQSLEVLRAVADQYFVGLYEPIKQNPVLDRRPEAVRMAARIGLLYAGEQAILIANRGYEFADPMAEEPDIMTHANFPGSRRIQTTDHGSDIDLEIASTKNTSYGDSIAVRSNNLNLAVAVPGFGIVHRNLEVVEAVSREGYDLLKTLIDSQRIEVGDERFGYLNHIYHAIRIARIYGDIVKDQPHKDLASVS